MQSKTRYRYVIQALAILVRSCGGLVWASAGPLLPFIMQEYGISRGTAGWYASVAPLTVAIFAIPMGLITARHSLKKMFVIGGLLQAAGILAPFADSYLLLVLTRSAFAMGTAITVPVAAAIASEWFTSRELPMVNGITMSLVNLGNALAFLATVPIAVALSWQAPLVTYGAIAITCTTAWAVFGRERHTEVVGESLISPAPGPEAKLNIRQVLTHRSTLLLAFSVMGNWALGNAIGSWLVTYYNEVFDMPLQRASSIAAIITVGGTIACIVGGIVSMRIGRRKPFLVISGALMGITAMSAVLFNNPMVIMLSIAAFGIFGNLHTPVLFTIPMELKGIPPRGGVLVINALQSGGTIGAFAGPLIVGYLTDITGSYLPGFAICAVLSLSMLVAGLLLPETGPKARYAVSAKST